MSKKLLMLLCMTIFSGCWCTHNCEKKNSSKGLSRLYHETYTIRIVQETYPLNTPINQENIHNEIESKLQKLESQGLVNRDEEEQTEGFCIQVLTWILSYVCC